MSISTVASQDISHVNVLSKKEEVLTPDPKLVFVLNGQEAAWDPNQVQGTCILKNKTLIALFDF